MFPMISCTQQTKIFFISFEKKDKIKLLALIHNIEYGGLKMLDLDSMILAQRTMCLKKYIQDYSGPWKFFLS